MKKLFGLLVIAMSFPVVLAADVVDTQIVDELEKQQQQEQLQKAETLTEQFTFNQVNSCQGMEQVFSDFLEMYKKYHPERVYSKYQNFWGDYIVVSDTNSMMNDMVMSPSSALRDEVMTESAMIAGGDFSTTNLQKAGVDEPEILKSNGEYLFYYVDNPYTSLKNHHISIIKTPQQNDLKDAQVVKKIALPASLNNIQLFLQGDKLIILAARYSYDTSSLLGGANTVAIVYDIKDIQNLVLEKMVNVNGTFVDARMIGSQLYLISSIYLDWYRIAYDVPEISVRDMLSSATPAKNEIIPISTSITLIGEGKTQVSKADYAVGRFSVPCENIFYLLPSEEAVKNYSITPNFTLITQIDVEKKTDDVQQKVVFGDVGEVHMSQNSLYLPSQLYFSSPMRCMNCWWPSYSAGQNTLIHKMNLKNNISYESSKIIPGVPLSQYSMDEDSAGNFRILTKTWSPNLATQFFVFDNRFELKGSLLDIEPGEEFKSSRYIGDKLYLVTFEQIDPLFVVDIADISEPKIVGELKIPGYSTYLHPYDTLQNGVQYLIGLGYSTEENQWGGVTNDGVKVDLYKIDFNANETVNSKCSSLIIDEVDSSQTSSCLSASAPCSSAQKVYESCVASVNPENILVELVAAHPFEGDKSVSPSVDNPRMFVWNAAKKQLQLPLFTASEIEVIYTGRNGNTWTETDYVLEFVGVKGLTISPMQGFAETISQHFPELKENLNGYYDYTMDFARVGYLGNVNYFLMGEFISFFSDTQKVTIWTL